MKTILLCIVSSTFSLSCFSQNFNISWKQSIKLRQATNNIGIVDRDNSGTYFVEGRVKSNRLSFNEPYSTIFKLYKFDQNFSPLFEKDYGKELKEFELNSFQRLNGDLFMFATDYKKKEKLYKVYGAKINKESGELDPNISEIDSYPLDENDDMRNVTITPVENGKSFLVVTRIVSNTRHSMGINVLDNSLRKKQTTTIKFSFGKIKEIADQALYENGKIILLVRRLQLRKTKPETGSPYEFKNYVLMIYNKSGAKEKELILDTEGKLLVQEQLFTHPAVGILLTGFYTDTLYKRTINGFCIQKINLQTGQVEKKSFKEINAATFNNQASGSQGKFSDDFVVRSIDVNPIDNSIIITSEVSKFSSDNYRGNSPGTRNTDYRFTSQHILVIDADKDGQIKWVNLIPKSQIEISQTGELTFASNYTSYKATGGGMPYYSSYTRILKNNNLVIILNDDDANKENPKYGDKLEDLYNFKKTNLYGISIDLATGKMNRKIIASNNKEDILAPRHSFVINNEILMPSWREHIVSKTELRLAQITVE